MKNRLINPEEPIHAGQQDEAHSTQHRRLEQAPAQRTEAVVGWFLPPQPTRQEDRYGVGHDQTHHQHVNHRQVQEDEGRGALPHPPEHVQNDQVEDQSQEGQDDRKDGEMRVETPEGRHQLLHVEP